MPPLISVIIPAYNAEALLEASIQSALSQNADNPNLCEVWVVDGASKDGTVALLNRLASENPALHFQSEPDKGVYDAMNKGVTLATGQFLYFLGAGDLVRPGAFAALAAQPNLGPRQLLYGDVRFLDRGTRYGGPMTLAELAWRNLPHQGAFYGREIFELTGLYDLRYPILADYQFNWRCFTTPGVEPQYFDFVVADYEAPGLSQRRYDTQFYRDWPKLLWKTAGFKSWWSYQYRGRFLGLPTQQFLRSYDPYYIAARHAISEANWKEVARQVRRCALKFPLIFLSKQWLYVLKRLATRDSRPF